MTNHDFNDKPIEAARDYESLISQGVASQSDYINLAAIYVACQDVGFISAHQISPTFSDMAFDRVVAIAEEFSSTIPETGFWRDYMYDVVIGDMPTKDHCKDLVRSGCIVASIYLKRDRQDLVIDRAIRQLVSEVEGETTIRERFIKAYLWDADQY
jgi:hypothetical protein